VSKHAISTLIDDFEVNANAHTCKKPKKIPTGLKSGITFELLVSDEAIFHFAGSVNQQNFRM
jgi:hypothetical protein